MRGIVAALLLAGCATTRPIGILWDKQPDAATSSRMVGDTCVITTRDAGDVPAREFGAGLRKCLAERGNR